MKPFALSKKLPPHPPHDLTSVFSDGRVELLRASHVWPQVGLIKHWIWMQCWGYLVRVRRRDRLPLEYMTGPVVRSLLPDWSAEPNMPGGPWVFIIFKSASLDYKKKKGKKRGMLGSTWNITSEIFNKLSSSESLLRSLQVTASGGSVHQHKSPSVWNVCSPLLGQF